MPIKKELNLVHDVQIRGRGLPTTSEGPGRVLTALVALATEHESDIERTLASGHLTAKGIEAVLREKTAAFEARVAALLSTHAAGYDANMESIRARVAAKAKANQKEPTLIEALGQVFHDDRTLRAAQDLDSLQIEGLIPSLPERDRLVFANAPARVVRDANGAHVEPWLKPEVAQRLRTESEERIDPEATKYLRELANEKQAIEQICGFAVSIAREVSPVSEDSIRVV